MIKKVANHPAEYLSLFSSLRENGTLREFRRQVELIAKTIPVYEEQEREQFKGDSLEILSEMFFNAFKADEAVGIKEYTPIAIEEDFGVDAIGINVNNDRCVIQVKYRANPLELVSYADIARTFCSGVIDLGLDPTKNHVVYVFTIANGVTWQCEKVFGKKLVVVHKEIIRTKIDNNKTFWQFAFDCVDSYLRRKIDEQPSA